METARQRIWHRYLVRLALLLLALVSGVIGIVWLMPEKALQGLTFFGRQSARLVHREITLSGGVQFAYLEGGQGRPVVLLHGFGGNKDHYAQLAQTLTNKYRLIIPDLPGFGDSTKLAGLDYSPTVQAERVHALLAALGISRVHMGGHSMGGQIAATFAARYPKETLSLLLINPAGIWSAKPSPMISNAMQGNNAMLISTVDDFINLLPYITETPPNLPFPIIKALAAEQIPLRALHETISKQLLLDSIESRIAGLQVPTQIVWGDHDRIIDVDAARLLQALIPKSRLTIMPGVGHNILYERPDELSRIYLNFLSAPE